MRFRAALFVLVVSVTGAQGAALDIYKDAFFGCPPPNYANNVGSDIGIARVTNNHATQAYQVTFHQPNGGYMGYITLQPGQTADFGNFGVGNSSMKYATTGNPNTILGTVPVVFTQGAILCGAPAGPQRYKYEALSVGGPPPPSSGAAQLCGELKSSSLDEATTQLQKNGAVIGEWKYSRTGVTNYSKSVAVSTTVNVGDVLVWKTLSGVGGSQTVTQNSKTITSADFTNIGTAEQPIYQYAPACHTENIGASAPPPSPTPMLPPTPTPTPVQHTQAAAGSTPGIYNVAPTTGNGGGGGTGQGVVLLNPKDIYNPIVESLDKLSQPGPAKNIGFIKFDGPRGKLDDLATKNTDNANKAREARVAGAGWMDDAKGKFTSWSGVSFGSASSIPLPLKGFNPAFPESVAIPSFFSIIRKVILWMMVAMWYFIAVKHIMSLRVEGS